MSFLTKAQRDNCEHEFMPSFFKFDRLLCSKCMRLFDSVELNEYINSLRQEIRDWQKEYDDCIGFE